MKTNNSSSARENPPPLRLVWFCTFVDNDSTREPPLGGGKIIMRMCRRADVWPLRCEYGGKTSLQVVIPSSQPKRYDNAWDEDEKKKKMASKCPMNVVLTSSRSCVQKPIESASSTSKLGPGYERLRKTFCFSWRHWPYKTNSWRGQA